MLNWHHLDSHQQRVATGIVLVVPVVIVLAAGPHWILSLLVGLVSGTGLWELQRMLFDEPLSRQWQALFLLSGLFLPIGASLGGFAGLHGALLVTFLIGFLSLLFFSPLDHSGMARLARFSLGWLYIPYLLSYVLLIGRLTEGTLWIFYTLSVTAADDIAAFYCGRKLGRHRLYEAVSPKKTIEGSLAGLVASVVTGTFFGIVFLKGVKIQEFFLLSGCLALLGQLGDLIESMIKRICGRKDSSNLLPGHGGILDRLDSLLFVFPATFFYLIWKGSVRL